MSKIFLLILVCFTIRCTSDPVSRITELKSPADGKSEVPNFTLSNQNKLFLSWIEGDSITSLKFSYLDEGVWSPSQLISQGTTWFVNWADFPSMVVWEDEAAKMAAHWLQKSAGGTYDYDIMVSISNDGGKYWKEPFILNDDGIPAEHGFVSLTAEASGVTAVWLDGRNTKDTLPDGSKLPMSLRAGKFNWDGSRDPSIELDNRICDCCQTDLAISDNNSYLAAYRDRSPEEVRDISIVQWQENEVQHFPNISSDNWVINGCPVNGPNLTILRDYILLNWFTGVDGKGTVYTGHFSDNNPSTMIKNQVNTHSALGRVGSVQIGINTALVSWLGVDQNEKYWVYVRKWSDGDFSNPAVPIIMSDQSRASGFPQISIYNDRAILAMTDIDTIKRVRTYWIDNY